MINKRKLFVAVGLIVVSGIGVFWYNQNSGSISLDGTSSFTNNGDPTARDAQNQLDNDDLTTEERLSVLEYQATQYALDDNLSQAANSLQKAIDLVPSLSLYVQLVEKFVLQKDVTGAEDAYNQAINFAADINNLPKDEVADKDFYLDFMRSMLDDAKTTGVPEDYDPGDTDGAS